MIISASRRTDIPAFYSDWFMNRIREEYFHRVNPFNSKQVTRISLRPADVDAIVFWTKDPGPLMAHLDELDERGYRYFFQFTLTPYGKVFEPNAPAMTDRIATFNELAGRIGPERVIWRYDPVILSNVTPVIWHLEQAERIASGLRNATRRMIFSFCDFYGKGNGRLHTALQGSGIVLEDIAVAERADELQLLVRGFGKIAGRYGFGIFSCSEAIELSQSGIEHGSCIDGNLIRKIFGRTPAARKDRNQRPSCGCAESADMGIYNTCRFGCRYCYANFNEKMVGSNFEKHDPNSPSLLDRHEGEITVQNYLEKKKKSAACQPPLIP